MKFIILSILLCCIFFIDGTAQNNILTKIDWSNLKLKGHVKELIELIDTNALITNYQFDADGGLLSYSETKKSKARKKSSETGKTDTVSRFSTTWCKYNRDKEGKIVEQTVDDERTTVYSYEIFKDSIKIKSVYNPPSGLSDCPMQQISTYNADGKLIRSVLFNCDGLAEYMRTVYSYDKNGFMVGIRSFTLPDTEEEMKFVNDKEGNPVSSETYSKDGQLIDARSETTTYLYDAKGNWIQKSWRFKRKGQTVIKNCERRISYY